MTNPIKTLTKKEWLLWVLSLTIVLISNLACPSPDPLTLAAALIGVTSLVFAAKSNVWAQIQKLTRRHIIGLAISGTAVTAVFYFILAALDTPNLVFSTISVITSFLAAALTMLRSSYYALGYAANDIVLIILWVLAALKDPSYLPVAVNFIIFFLNDMYGFVSWKKRELQQAL